MTTGTENPSPGAAPAAGGTPAVIPPTDGGSKPWFDGITGDALGYITNRGLDKKSANEALLTTIEAHRNAESKLGAPADQLVRLPKDINDTAARDAILAKLGRAAPAKPEDYAPVLKDIKGIDDDFRAWAAPAAHKLGLSGEQAAGFIAELAAKTAAFEEEQQKQIAANNTVQENELKKNWGARFEVNKFVAQKAFESLGFTTEMVAAMQSQVGFKQVMETFLKLGEKIGEDKFVNVPNGASGAGQRYTQEGAQARLKDLRNDEGWGKKLISGDLATLQEFNDLSKLAVGAV